LTSAWKKAESDNESTNLSRRETGDKLKEECVAATVAHKMEGKPLVLMQVKSGGIYNKTLDLWNVIDTHNQDVVTGTESWLSEEISNAKVLGIITQFQDTHTHIHTGTGGTCIGVNDYNTFA
jgi:hypothetical protein